MGTRSTRPRRITPAVRAAAGAAGPIAPSHLDPHWQSTSASKRVFLESYGTESAARMVPVSRSTGFESAATARSSPRGLAVACAVAPGRRTSYRAAFPIRSSCRLELIRNRSWSGRGAPRLRSSLRRCMSASLAAKPGRSLESRPGSRCPNSSTILQSGATPRASPAWRPRRLMSTGSALKAMPE